MGTKTARQKRLPRLCKTMTSDVMALMTQNRVELEKLLQKIRPAQSQTSLRRDMQAAVAAVSARLAVVRQIILPSLRLESRIDLQLREENDAIRENLAELLAARSSDIARHFRVVKFNLHEYELKLSRIATPHLKQMTKEERKSLGFLSQSLLEQYLGSDGLDSERLPTFDWQLLLEEARVVIGTFSAKP